MQRKLIDRTAAMALLAGLLVGPGTAAQTSDDAGGVSVIAPGDPLPRKEGAPLERILGVRSVYGSVDVGDGIRLRTIISTPVGAETPRHPLLFTQWVSCGSIEYAEGGGAREILAALAWETGLALVRVDRAGAGDSEGPDCNALDYDTEVDHYVNAYRKVLASGEVDASKIYIYGASLGSTTAPLVAKALQDEGFDIAGIAVQGGGAVTYFERMLNFDRIYLERRPDAVAPGEIHDEMVGRILFHTEYLLKDRHPDDVAADGPGMAAVRADVRGMGEADHYGRPFAWHQQAAKRDFLSAWASLDAPVLVIFNGFEQFEMRHGHALIVDTVNRLRPGSATLIEQESIGHSNMRYPDIVSAYAGENGETAWRETAGRLVGWFRSLEE